MEEGVVVCRCKGCFPPLGQQQAECIKDKISVYGTKNNTDVIVEISDYETKANHVERIIMCMRSGLRPTKQLREQFERIPKIEFDAITALLEWQGKI